MPFTPASLGALVQGNGFTLWHYRTADARSTVANSAYFAVGGENLRPGDLMILQAADALALVPVRTGPTVGSGTGGNGITLDSLPGVVSLIARPTVQQFSITQTVQAVLRSLILAPLAAIALAGSPIPVQAQVIGPVTQVVFTLRDAAGNVVPPTRTVVVNAGRADSSFPAPPLGDGYRVSVADAADPALTVTGNSFSVGDGGMGGLFRLLLENGSVLLAENGDAIGG